MKVCWISTVRNPSDARFIASLRKLKRSKGTSCKSNLSCPHRIRSITARWSMTLPDVHSINPCCIQVEYGTRQIRSNSGTRSWGIQKKGSNVQTLHSSKGGNTNTTEVKSVVQDASTPAQHGLPSRSHSWISRSN